MSLAVLGIIAPLGLSRAQDPKGEKKTGGETDLPVEKEKVTIIPFWDLDHAQGLRAAVPMIAGASPLGALSIRVAASENVPPIAGWAFEFSTVLPLTQKYLDAIVDKRPLPNLFRKELKELTPQDRGFYLAFVEALRRSNDATMEMFERSADENSSVVASHLRATPDRYRGKVITVKGKLALIRREPPPRFADPAIKDIYTGWIIGPTKGAPPFTIVFTELPKGHEISEKFDLPVTFYGYFLGQVLFPHDKQSAAANPKDIVSPYFVGKTVIVHGKKPPPAVEEDTEPFAFQLFAIVLGGILAVIVCAILLTMWFRRGDERTKSQLAEVREKHRPFNLEADASPGEEPPLAGPPPEGPDGTAPPR